MAFKFVVWDSDSVSSSIANLMSGSVKAKHEQPRRGCKCDLRIKGFIGYNISSVFIRLAAI